MSFSGNGMEAFQYTALPARVVFGFGTIAKVADELVLWVARGLSFFPTRIMQRLPRRVSCASSATSVSSFRRMRSCIRRWRSPSVSWRSRRL